MIKVLDIKVVVNVGDSSKIVNNELITADDVETMIDMVKKGVLDNVQIFVRREE